MSDWMNTAVLCGNGSMESGEWMSLSVQSNVSHSSSIKVKDSGDRAERKRRTVRTMSTVTAECACAGQVQTRSDSARHPALELQSKVLEDFTIMEKAPTNFKCASGCFREGSFEALSGTAHREQSDENISIDT